MARSQHEADIGVELRDQTLSPGDQLLICCADMRGEEEVYLRARQLVARGLDWRLLIDKANRHGVGPLLCSLVLKMEEARDRPDGGRGESGDGRSAWGAGQPVPEHAIQSLKSIYYANAVRNLKLESELDSILRCLNAKSIVCMVLKGLFVLKTLYGNLALRPIGDIDLLIHPDDLPRVDAALREIGYSPDSDDALSRFHRRVHFHVSYQAEERDFKVVVEVHWNIQDQFNVLRIDVDQIWGRAVPWGTGDRGDARALAMCPEDLLTYLCYHADKHACYSKYIEDFSLVAPSMVIDSGASAPLIWYADVLRCVHLHQATLNWALLADNCRAWGIEGEVYSTLSIVNRVFGTSVGTRALARLDPPKLKKRRARLYRLLFAAKGAGTSPRSSPPAAAAAPPADSAASSRATPPEVVAPNAATPVAPSRITGFRARLLDPDSDLKFRPARFLDMAAYIFPDIKSVSRRYSASPPSLYLFYLAHVCKASFRSLMYLGLLVVCILRKH